MIAEISTHEYQSALEHCSRNLLWEASVDAPPIDAVQLAENLGLVVAEDNSLATRARFVRLGGNCGTILLGPEDRPERRQWSVAHEVGEAFAFRVFESLGISPKEAPPSAREQVANQMACSFLLPMRWFRSIGEQWDFDLYELKRIFSTASYELIARRVLDCHPETVVVSVYDHGMLTWRQTNRGSVAGPRPVEKDCQRQCHQYGEPVWASDTETYEAGFRRVRCWPVHEIDWRREIVLTEVEPDW